MTNSIEGSVFLQVDGNVSEISDSTDEDNDSNQSSLSNYETDDEVDAEPVPANLAPVPDQDVAPGQPQIFDVNMSVDVNLSQLPLPRDELQKRL